MQQIHLHVIDIFIVKHEAEIQTEIDNSTIYIKNYNKMKNKICNIPKKTYTDVATSTKKYIFYWVFIYL